MPGYKTLQPAMKVSDLAAILRTRVPRQWTWDLLLILNACFFIGYLVFNGMGAPP